jgi:hypothetical protein
MFFDDDYSHIPLLPKRKAAPTPVVSRAAVDRDWAREQAQAAKSERDRRVLTIQAQAALEVEKARAAYYEPRVPGLTILFYMLALKSRPAIREIAFAFVLDQHDVTREEILGERRLRRISKARWDVIGMMYCARHDISLPTIGRMVNVDHTSVLHALRSLGIHRPSTEDGAKYLAKRREEARRKREALAIRTAAGYAPLGRNPKLTPATVIEMRRLFGEGVSQSDLGRRYGFSLSTVWKVVRRSSWRHLP